MTVRNCQTCAHRRVTRKGEECLRIGGDLTTARLFGWGLGCNERFSGWEAIPEPPPKPPSTSRLAPFWRRLMGKPNPNGEDE